MASLRILFTFFQKRAKAEKCNFTTGLKPCIHNNHRPEAAARARNARAVVEDKRARIRATVVATATTEPGSAGVRHI